MSFSFFFSSSQIHPPYQADQPVEYEIQTVRISSQDPGTQPPDQQGAKDVSRIMDTAVHSRKGKQRRHDQERGAPPPISPPDSKGNGKNHGGRIAGKRRIGGVIKQQVHLMVAEWTVSEVQAVGYSDQCRAKDKSGKRSEHGPLI
jgi:hypothetical protein